MHNLSEVKVESVFQKTFSIAKFIPWGFISEIPAMQAIRSHTSVSETFHQLRLLANQYTAHSRQVTLTFWQKVNSRFSSVCHKEEIFSFLTEDQKKKEKKEKKNAILNACSQALLTDTSLCEWIGLKLQMTQ